MLCPGNRTRAPADEEGEGPTQLARRGRRSVPPRGGPVPATCRRGRRRPALARQGDERMKFAATASGSR
eukprot:scaffold1973_cov399-Prasinococcus_capsulatus_cf.AAC.20